MPRCLYLGDEGTGLGQSPSQGYAPPFEKKELGSRPSGPSYF